MNTQPKEIIILSKKDQEVFVDALINPPEPNQKLIDSFKKYKKSAFFNFKLGN